MNWGKSIVLAFVLFGVFIATLVTVCFRQDVSLVTRDYYTEELGYQKQIDRMTHTAELKEKPSISVEPGVLKVTYADFERLQQGALTLFRPSDPAQDKVFTIARSAGVVQYFPIDGMQHGMYRAKLKWEMDGREFYVEEVINL